MAFLAFTPELVAWVKDRSLETEILASLEEIGRCSDRLIAGEDLQEILRDHHKAQVALGVVPAEAKKRIEEIESTGGAAKILGAGARTGGGGMILSLPA